MLGETKTNSPSPAQRAVPASAKNEFLSISIGRAPACQGRRETPGFAQETRRHLRLRNRLGPFPCGHPPGLHDHLAGGAKVLRDRQVTAAVAFGAFPAASESAYTSTLLSINALTTDITLLPRGHSSHLPPKRANPRQNLLPRLLLSRFPLREAFQVVPHPASHGGFPLGGHHPRRFVQFISHRHGDVSHSFTSNVKTQKTHPPLSLHSRTSGDVLVPSFVQTIGNIPTMSKNSITRAAWSTCERDKPILTSLSIESIPFATDVRGCLLNLL